MTWMSLSAQINRPAASKDSGGGSAGSTAAGGAAAAGSGTGAVGVSGAAGAVGVSAAAGSPGFVGAVAAAGVSVAGDDAGSVAGGGCAAEAVGPWLDELGLGDGVAVDDGVEDVADAARTPVMVGAAEEVATAAAGVWPADLDDRFVRKKTMPMSATTASAMTVARRSQYTRGDNGPTGCITGATVVSHQRFSREQRRRRIRDGDR